MLAETVPPGATAILMPKLGQAMEAGTVVQWHAQDGARVAKGAAILAIETDKASYDLEAPAAGALHIAVAPGVEAPVGAVLGWVGGTAPGPSSPASGGPVAAARGAAGSAAPAGAARTPARTAGGKVLAAPKARRLAEERGIDLAMVQALGADGVISAEDVLRAVAARAVAPAAAGASTPAASAANDGPHRIRERRPLTGLRRTAALSSRGATGRAHPAARGTRP